MEKEKRTEAENVRIITRMHDSAVRALNSSMVNSSHMVTTKAALEQEIKTLKEVLEILAGD